MDLIKRIDSETQTRDPIKSNYFQVDIKVLITPTVFYAIKDGRRRFVETLLGFDFKFFFFSKLVAKGLDEL